MRGYVRSPDGTAVLAYNTASTGYAIGINANTSSPDGYAGYFTGGKNYFEGNVGIGTIFPGSPLTVDGMIESEAGGFKFPDGTIQTTAGGGGGGSCLWVQDQEDNIRYGDGFVGIGMGTGTPVLHMLHVQGNSYFTGNVGIGEPNPMAELDVAGSVNMDGFRLG